MWIPEKAIICAPTPEDAHELFAFLGDAGYTFGGKNARTSRHEWDVYCAETCYNLEPGEMICYCNRSYYAHDADEFDCGRATGYASRYMPTDKRLRFISVPDFISLCNHGSKLQNIVIENLDSLL